LASNDAQDSREGGGGKTVDLLGGYLQYQVYYGNAERGKLEPKRKTEGQSVWGE